MTAEGGAIVTKIYVPYETTEGQTAKIAEYIADVIRGYGHEAQTADIKRSGHAVPGDYDAVIVGASIHMGKHDGYVGDFVRKNLALLERLPSAFFSVSLAAHGDTAEADRSRQAWQPGHGHLARLRVHRVGRGEEIRGGLPGGVPSCRCGSAVELGVRSLRSVSAVTFSAPIS
jgi:hypothetical protein